MFLRKALAVCLLAICLQALAEARVAELGEKFMEYRGDQAWLIKFYAPWCTHCKQLEPIWNQVSQVLVNSEVRVARLDCTRYTAISQQFKVSGFPTIIYLDKDKQIQFKGDRSLRSILEFTHRVHGPAVRELKTCEDMWQVLKKEPSAFVLAVHPNDESANSTSIRESYKSYADTMHPDHFFLEVNISCVDKDRSTTTVFVHKDGSFTAFDENGETSLGDWIKFERFSAFQQVTHANFNSLLATKKMLVVAVLEENQLGKLENKAMEETRKMMETVAVNTRHIYHQKFLFGWFPSTDIPFSIAMTELQVPSIMVIEPGTLKYYLSEKCDAPDALISLLDAIIVADPLPANYGGNTFFYRLYRCYFEFRQSIKNMYRSSPVLTVVVFIVPLSFLSALIYLTCFANLLDEDTEEDENDEDFDPSDGDNLGGDSEHEKND